METGVSLARRIVTALGGHWHGSYALCKCPSHRDMTPSLSVRPHEPLPWLKCFAQCEFRDITAELRRRGLWPDADGDDQRSAPRHAPVRFCGISVAETMKNRQRAQAIWDAAQPSKGTLVDAYLRARGIRIQVSDQLRYSPLLRHSETKREFPVMVARLSDNKGFVGVQRTFLDGPKKADIPNPKKTLGRMFGASVRLHVPATDTLGIAEGIETALSAKQLYKFACWATLSAQRLGAIEIPPDIRNIVIFGDAGETGRREAERAAEIYEQRGLRAEIIYPSAHFSADAGDFNDAVRLAG